MLGVCIILAICLLLFVLNKFYKGNELLCIVLIPFGLTYCIIKALYLVTILVSIPLIIISSIVLVFLLTYALFDYYLVNGDKEIKG